MDGRISNLMQVCSLRRYELIEGKERGLRVIDCDNGRLRFLLNESKALDMMQLYHEGQNISYISKNGFTAREIPFSKRFEGGMLYTVGLDSAGAREGFPLHGTFHNIPAKVIEAVCDENGIRVVAEIEDACSRQSRASDPRNGEIKTADRFCTDGRGDDPRRNVGSGY